MGGGAVTLDRHAYRYNDEGLVLAILGQASRYSLERVNQDPVVMEGHREQV